MPNVTSDQIAGSEILSIANDCWRDPTGRKPGRYAGFQWLVAVGQAKRQIERKRGGARDRREEAEHTTTVLFNHARQQSEQRIDAIALEAQKSVSVPRGWDGVSAIDTKGVSVTGELYQFASEVQRLLNGPLSGGFGVFDPQMIITLIMAIINAIKACKNPAPSPTPTPVPTPAT